MNIVVVGVNHKTAPIELREQVAFSKEDVEQALPTLINHPEIEEAVIVSTCNRVELYCVGAFENTARRWLFEHKQVACPEDFSERCYFYEGVQAVEHLMRVACGLDSLVLGEPEILGQVKSGFTQACLHGSVGSLLSRLFRQVFKVAKQVRTNTKIGACPVSIASTSAMFVQDWLQSQNIVTKEVQVLIVGSGMTSRLVAKHVAKLRPHAITIAGRNIQKVAELANEVGATAAGMDNLTELVSKCEVIITATASDMPIFHQEMFSGVTKALVLDLAVPRDVDPQVAELEAITLCCIDDLKIVIGNHLDTRVHAAQQADNMIAQFSSEFMLSLRTPDADEVIRQYRAQIESQCQNELEKALKRFKCGADGEEVLKQFAHNLTNKIMHVPCEQMRQASTEGRNEMLTLAYELFGITT